MRLRSARNAFFASATLLSFFVQAKADDSAPKLRVNESSRFIEEAPVAPPLPLSELPASKDEPKTPPSHTKGPKPATPKSKLPAEVPLSTPNAKARRSIAEGPTTEEITRGPDDAQLNALRDAEKVLFPESLNGIRTSWSFDVPSPQSEEVRAHGLPLLQSPEGSSTILSADDLAWLKSLTLPDLPIQLDRHVVTYLKFYRDSHRGRTIAAIWTKKSGRYVTEIKAKLRRAGLPTDLVWLSMIESGHNPTIQSPAGAVGLWQFIAESGKMYGLTVDRWVDERRDPARSTDAAIRFLGDLYRRFGNWELAMGAYNMGYAGMSQAITKYNTNDYWALSRMESGIPWETALYVPKVFALAIVMNNRDAFGVGRQQLDPAESFDTILVSPATSLSDAARALNLSVDELKSRNPQYLTDRLPPPQEGNPKKWPLKVPRGTSLSAAKKLSGATGSTHRVRLGDTPEHIASDYGVSLSALQKENALLADEVLSPGTILMLPPGAKLRADHAPVDVVVSRNLAPSAGEQVVYYQVRHYDQLSEIAEAFGVTESDLARWNRLSPSAHLRKGMTLQVLVSKTESLPTVRYIAADRARTFLAGSSEFHDYFEGQKGKKRVMITAKEGDSLESIGKRYGMTVGSMERVNRRSRSTKVVPGEHLIVYTSQNVSHTSSESEPGELPAIQAPYPGLLPTAQR